MNANFSASVNGSNITDDSHGLCINHEAWGTAIVLVESTFIIIGNLFVLIVLCKYPPRKFKPLNYFIVQLAIADLCIGFIVLWIGFLSAKIYSHMHLISGIIVYGILATTSSASTLSVLYIAVDRYIYILKNNNYKRIMTRTIVILLIAIAWLLPTIVFIVAPLLGWSCVEECDCLLYNSDENAEYCQGDVCSQMMTPFRSETLLIGGLCLLLLLIVSVIIYVMLLSKVRSKTQKPVKQSHRKASELRMIKTMVIVLTGFLLTTGPLGILCIVSYFYNVRSLHFAMRILVVISNVNSIMNPFFYFWRIPQMNRNLKIMWSSFFKFAHNFFCCIPKTRQQKRSSIADSKLYVCGLHHGNQTSESSVSNNSKIHYLSKNVRIKVNFGRKCNANHITTPFNSSDII